MAGIIAASTNNGLGMAGIAHGAKVLPVRVLGKCGGYDSDIAAGMLWAAGIDQAVVNADVRAMIATTPYSGDFVGRVRARQLAT